MEAARTHAGTGYGRAASVMRCVMSGSTIGTDLVIRGRIRRVQELDIFGYVEGGIEAGAVRIHPSGRVFGQVRADQLEVNGLLQGDVAVKHLIRIGSTGQVSGNVRYGQLAMAAGGDLSADVRNVPPEVHGDLQIAVRAGREVPVTLADLYAVDPDDSDETIRFDIAASEGGFVALLDQPRQAVESFTQANLAAGHVLFVHDGSSEAGSFDVVVTDKAGAKAEPQRVAVAVLGG